MKSKLFQITIILLGVLLIVKITGNFLRLFKAVQQIKTMEEQVLKLEKEKEKLSLKYQYYQTPEFIEEEARNKLNMAKPGETIVILPPNLGEFLNHPKNKDSPSLPNWKKWWDLFF